MDGATFWPASPLAGDHDQILDQLERSAPVRLIATMGDLTYALADESLEEAWARAEAGRYDFLPVRDVPNGPVIGLMRRTGAAGRVNGEAVRAAMQPLSGGNLISADAPLLDFVYTADTNPCRLVLDRSEIRGLVTLSDLQRLPVRTALFGLFIHFELLLTEALRRKLPRGEMVFDLLSERRSAAVRTRWEVTRDAGMDRDAFESLTFADKKTIAVKIKLFGISGERINRELRDIEEELRNPLAHSRMVATSSAEATQLVRATQLTRDWIGIAREARE